MPTPTLRPHAPFPCISAALAVLSLSAALWPRLSLAQSLPASIGDAAIQQLDPTPAGDAFFSVSSPSAEGHLHTRAHLLADYAINPLRLFSEPAAPIVGNQVFLHANASFALWHHLLLSVNVPVAVVNSGDNPAVPKVLFQKQSAGFGDLRFSARGTLSVLGTDSNDPHSLAAALEGSLFVPTEHALGYVSDHNVRGAFRAVFGGTHALAAPFVWSANLGLMLRASDAPHSLTFGAAAALALDEGLFRVGLEVFGALPLGGALLSASGVELQTPAPLNAEALLTARYRFLKQFEVGLGGGPGLTQAIGTPKARFLLLASWSPEVIYPALIDPLSQDDDRDGIANGVDACPSLPGVEDSDKRFHGCPPDKDKDGVPNKEDACADAAGPKNVDLSKNGCPPDRDADGVPDINDNCPDVKGSANKVPGQNGCPIDRDGDGILDIRDACPDQPGERSSDRARSGCPDDVDKDGIKPPEDACPYEKGASHQDPAQNGCPKYVRIRGDEIVLLQPIQFKLYGKEKEDTSAFPIIEDILSEIKDVLDQHPEIEQVEVQGHADGGNLSEAKFNEDLSNTRAHRVWWWLVQKGVPKERLIKKGYGDAKPIGDNNTKEGRAMNRRVQLTITKRKPD